MKERGTDTSAFEAALAKPISSKNETKWLATAVDESRILLGRRQASVERPVTVTGICTGDELPEHPLPFDVEVHQLPSGQRIVLDSHRLLIPDIAWIDWMREDVDAMPRVWATRVTQESGGSCASLAASQHVLTGPLRFG